MKIELFCTVEPRSKARHRPYALVALGGAEDLPPHPAGKQWQYWKDVEIKRVPGVEPADAEKAIAADGYYLAQE